MELDQTHRIQTPVEETYDRVAADYAQELSGELAHKPFDRKMLDWLVERLADSGTICDLGCGPGQVAGYLFDRGAASCGIDLSAGMVAQARSLHPQISFTQGDMLDLSLVDGDSFASIAAFYSIVNLPPAALAPAFSEMFRVLSPGGFLLLSFHIGTETVHRDEWWEKKVSIDFYFYETAKILDVLSSAGFSISEAMEREPYPEVEYPSRRAYIFAQKPAR
jgi:SAM-dependent methyltransferase